jgi:fatty acid desaturase
MAIIAVAVYALPIVLAYHLLHLHGGLFTNLFVVVVTVGLSAISAFGVFLIISVIHESAHYNLYNQRWLNHIVGIFVATIIPWDGLSRARFLETHSHHHIYLNTTKDPEDVFITIENPQLSISTVFIGIKETLKSFMEYSIASFKTLFSSNETKWPKQHKLLYVYESVCYFFFIAIQLYFIVKFPLLLIFYLLTLFISLIFIVVGNFGAHMFYLYPAIISNPAPKWYAKFIEVISFGSYLHIEHHAYPTVPCHQLPALSRYLHSLGFYKRNNIPINSIRAQLMMSE